MGKTKNGCQGKKNVASVSKIISVDASLRDWHTSTERGEVERVNENGKYGLSMTKSSLKRPCSAWASEGRASTAPWVRTSEKSMQRNLGRWAINDIYRRLLLSLPRNSYR